MMFTAAFDENLSVKYAHCQCQDIKDKVPVQSVIYFQNDGNY